MLNAKLYTCSQDKDFYIANASRQRSDFMIAKKIEVGVDHEETMPSPSLPEFKSGRI